MSLAAEYKMSVNGEAGLGNIYPAWSPINSATDPNGPGAYAYTYSGTWNSPAAYKLNTAANCVLTQWIGGVTSYPWTFPPGRVQSTEVTRPMASSPTGKQCLHFKYLDPSIDVGPQGPMTSFMCEYMAAMYGVSVLPASTLNINGYGGTAMPTFHGCNTVWTWEWAGYPSGTSMNGGDEGSKHQCYIGFLDHLC